MKKTQGALILTLASIFMCATFSNISINRETMAEELSVSTATIKETYSIGDTFEYGQVTFENGKSSEGAIVYLPDGTSTSSKSLVIRDYGKYTIKYYYFENGKMNFGYKYFVVDSNIVSFNNPNSSYWYGFNNISGKEGLNISVTRGDEGKINPIVDISKIPFSESFIEFAFAPEVIGTPDAYKVYMTLTDVYDRTNTIKIRMQNWSDFGTWADGMTYIDARAKNQEWTSSVEKGDANHHKRGENNKGWYIDASSMVGRYSNGKRYQGSIGFFFDYPNRGIVTSSNSYGSKYMVDLDDENWYDLNSEELWNGFTTGEVNVSFSSESNNGTAVNITIIKLFGVDLSQGTFKDENDPIINIDYKGYDEDNLPFAVVGKKYELFDAIGFDSFDGSKNVIKNLYFDYYGNKTLVNITDNSFVPTKAGTYTVCYYTVDNSGNSVLKTLDIQAKLDSLSAAQISYVSNSASGLCGEEAKLFDSVSLQNANGNVKFEITASNDKETVAVDPVNYTFTPHYQGIYTVSIVAKDYVSEYKTTCEFEVTDNPQPYILDEAKLPKYMIKGATYNIPKLNAEVYTDGTINKPLCDTFINDSKFDGDSFLADKEGNLSVKYSYTNGGLTAEKIYNVKVIDVGYKTENLNLLKYFVSDNVTCSLNEFDMSLVASTDSTVQFINMLSEKNVRINFNVSAQKNNFKKAVVYLEDAYNPDIKIKTSFIENGDISKMEINDSKKYREIVSNFIGTSSEAFSFTFNCLTNSIYGTGNIGGVVEKDLNGNDFNGFPSGYVYISVGFEDVEGESEIILNSINNQFFYQTEVDSVKPEIGVVLSNGDKLFGDLITLNKPVFTDVLDPYVVAEICVMRPDGEYVTTVDGILLDGSSDPNIEYVIKANQIGDYMIRYTIKDSKNRLVYNYGFTVVDAKAPEVKLAENTRSISVGGKIEKPSIASLKDDYTPTEDIKVYYYVKNPKGQILLLNDSFVANESGMYTVYIYAFDNNFNSCVTEYYVYAK